MSGFRIWSTADGRYVGDGHLDAAFLASGPADKAPDDFDPETFQSADGTYPLRAAVEAGDEPESDAEPTEPEADDDAEPTEPEKPEPAAASKRRGK